MNEFIIHFIKSNQNLYYHSIEIIGIKDGIVYVIKNVKDESSRYYPRIGYIIDCDNQTCTQVNTRKNGNQYVFVDEVCYFHMMMYGTSHYSYEADKQKRKQYFNQWNDNVPNEYRIEVCK